jgi:hypothetical protein
MMHAKACLALIVYLLFFSFRLATPLIRPPEQAESTDSSCDIEYRQPGRDPRPNKEPVSDTPDEPWGATASCLLMCHVYAVSILLLDVSRMKHQSLT